MRRLGFAPLVRALMLCALLSSGAAFNALAPSAEAAPKSKRALPLDGEDLPIDGDAGGLPEEALPEDHPQVRAKPPTTGLPAPVTFTAYMSEGGAPMTTGVVWRIFTGRPRSDGVYQLITSMRDARPTLSLSPGEYLVNVAYGRANLTRKIGVWPEKPVNEDFVVNAGGLRLSATLAHAPITQENFLKFEIFSDAQDQSGNRQKIAGEARPGVVLRLNSGLYHVLSTYGDANSVVGADILIEPGKITEAGIDHDAGKVTFRLVQRPGGEAVADTRWTIYNVGGDVIKESAGAFPSHILSVGEYRVAAQHGERQYAGAFTIAAGESKLVEVLMQ